MSYRPNTVARLEYEEVEFRISLKNYRNDARRRNRLWDLPEWLFRSLFNRACVYCDVMQRQPVCCPKHGKPFRGAGWVLAGGQKFALFECPVAACHQTRVIP